MNQPALAPRQRVSTIVLQVDALPAGGLRFSSPLARGWAGCANTPQELARVIHAAFVEVSVAAYARAHREAYDLDALTSQVLGDALAGVAPRRVRRPRTVRHRSYAVEAWTKMEDGRWLSPSGRAYRADSAAVRNVVRKRADKGLPT